MLTDEASGDPVGYAGLQAIWRGITSQTPQHVTRTCRATFAEACVGIAISTLFVQAERVTCLTIPDEPG